MSQQQFMEVQTDHLNRLYERFTRVTGKAIDKNAFAYECVKRFARFWRNRFDR